MEPEIHHGDIVIIDPGVKELEKGSLGVFRIHQEITVKRYYRYNDNILLQPTNRSYSPIVVAEKAECVLIGKVIYKIVKC